MYIQNLWGVGSPMTPTVAAYSTGLVFLLITKDEMTGQQKVR